MSLFVLDNKNITKALQNFHPEWNARTPTARAANIFITLNPIDIACYSRKQHDRFMENAQPTTKDNEITALHWLLIDLDPKRMSGVSSSEEELELAKKKARTIHDFLSDRGFKEPIRAMSGNGVHLVYRFDVSNTAENVSVFEKALILPVSANFGERLHRKELLLPKDRTEKRILSRLCHFPLMLMILHYCKH